MHPAMNATRKFGILALLLVFSLTVLVFPASAHQNSLAASKITFENKKLVMSLLIDQKSVLELNGTDITKVQTINEEQLTGAIKDKTFDYIKQGLHVKNNGSEMTPQLEGMSVPDLADVEVDLAFTSSKLIDKIAIDYNLFFEKSNNKHQNVATIENGDHTDEFVFTASNRHLDMTAGVEMSFWATLKQFVLMGVEHILTGYDHLAFLFALILIGGSFKNMLKIVTSFTVAHSITLILASLEIVALPSRFIESMIALSILYVAVENFIVKNTRYRWILTFCFGLIHGFGFAGALAETQIPKNHFWTSLLTFNVGVEIGQMLVVCVLLPLILYIKRYSWNRGFVYTISSCIGLFGLLWVLQRVFELNILPFLAV
jgi:hydrogenase/urease accessory protein HupE/uncharacterized protein YcfL